MFKLSTIKIITILACILSSVSGFAIEKKIIYIGVASNFSDVMVNSYNPFGHGVRSGIRLALERVNADLASKGIEVRTKEFDYGTNRLNIKKVVQSAATSDVVAVVGYEFSDDALLAAPLHQDLRLPMITPSASADRLEKFSSFVHQGTFNNSYQGEALAHFAVKKLKLTKAIMIVAADCAYCQDLAAAISGKLEKLNGRVIRKIIFLNEERNFDDIVQRVSKEDFDFIIVPNQELASARVVTALLQSGIHKPILGGDGWRTLGNDFFGSDLSRKFKGYTVTHWQASLNTPLSLQFVKEYEKSFGAKPTDSAALAYDSTLILGAVIKQLKTVDRSFVEEALQNLKYFRGTTGQFVFAPGRAPQKSILLLKATPLGFVLDRILEPNL